MTYDDCSYRVGKCIHYRPDGCRLAWSSCRWQTCSDSSIDLFVDVDEVRDRERKRTFLGNLSLVVCFLIVAALAYWIVWANTESSAITEQSVTPSKTEEKTLEDSNEKVFTYDNGTPSQGYNSANDPTNPNNEYTKEDVLQWEQDHPGETLSLIGPEGNEY